MSSQQGSNKHPDKAYIRKLKDTDRIEIKLFYADEDLDLNRWFVFNRLLDDNVQQIKERVTANLDKACLKAHKIKQKSAKKGRPLDPPSYKLLVDVKQSETPVDSAVIFRDLIQQPNVALSVNDKVYKFDVDPPTVNLLKLPSAPMAGFPIYPTKLEVENCTPSQCDFLWFKSSPSLASPPEPNSNLWKPVSQGMVYTISNSDIGSWLQLKCIPKNSPTREGMPEIAVTSQVVEAGPGPCPFEVRHNFTKERTGDNG